MPKLLLVANVSKEHIRKFHIPLISLLKENGWAVDVACRLDESVPESQDGETSGGNIDMQNVDPMFADAARMVVAHQQGSTPMLQRKYNIGFNRAGRIMDQLCQTGIVGEQDGSKPRQVLCSDEADLEFRLKSLL